MSEIAVSVIVSSPSVTGWPPARIRSLFGLLWLLFAWFAGGLAGAYFGALRFRQDVLKYTLAFVLMMASYKLLFTHP